MAVARATTMSTSTRPRAAANSPETVPPAVSVSGLSKSYGGIHALIDMELQVRPGTVHAVVGENGAGKSTLMKILAGAVRPDAGSIAVDGRAVEFDSPAQARGAGIGIVYQELSLFPERSILANIFPDRQPTRFGLVDHAEMLRLAAPKLASIGLDVDPDTLAGDLDLDERQLLEICRVLVEEPRMLILDEPNSALNDREIGAPVRRPAPAARDGRDHPLRIAPSRRGVRHRRPHHGHAQWPAGGHQRPRRHLRWRRWCRRWSAHARRSCSRRGAAGATSRHDGARRAPRGGPGRR